MTRGREMPCLVEKRGIMHPAPAEEKAVRALVASTAASMRLCESAIEGFDNIGPDLDREREVASLSEQLRIHRDKRPLAQSSVKGGRADKACCPNLRRPDASISS